MSRHERPRRNAFGLVTCPRLSGTTPARRGPQSNPMSRPGSCRCWHLACPGTRREDGPLVGDVEAVERAVEGILAMLERIVSGGQTGADQAVARRGVDCRAQDPRAERRRQPGEPRAGHRGPRRAVPHPTCPDGWGTGRSDPLPCPGNANGPGRTVRYAPGSPHDRRDPQPFAGSRRIPLLRRSGHRRSPYRQALPDRRSPGPCSAANAP